MDQRVSLEEAFGLGSPVPSGGEGAVEGDWAEPGLEALHAWSRIPAGGRVRIGASGRPVLVELTYGKGRVLALAESRWLSNAGLSLPGALPMAMRLLVAPGLPVVFDELRHGVEEAPGLGYILLRYRLLPFAAATLLLMGLLAWRVAPPEGEPAEEGGGSGAVRDSLLEIRTGLYGRALSPEEAVRRLARELQQADTPALERHSGLRVRLDGLLGRVRSLQRSPPRRLDELVPMAQDVARFLKEIP